MWIFYFYTMDKIILEYSEVQKCFHFNYGNQPENFNTYRTILKGISHERASELVSRINKNYEVSDLTFDEVKLIIESYE